MLKKPIKLKDPGSAITHFIGLLGVLLLSPMLLIRAANNPGNIHLVSVIIFIITIFLLYTASTVYHSLDLSPRGNRVLRKLDHMAIYSLIAGTYTPICLITLGTSGGYKLLVIIWSMAFLGIIVTAFWVNVPKWLAALIYIVMGWTCVLAFKPLWANLSLTAFLYLLAGGIIYTIGGIIYALKLPLFNKISPNFGSHEIFHLFVMGGSLCHIILIYNFISVMPIK